jgi:LuxR family maltose regulon positive regulatory protein
MSAPILGTKLYIPPPRLKVILRNRLIERLNEGHAAGRKLTLISAPAGFGKTTLVSEWVADCDQKVAWLSLDEGDNDDARFLTYFVAALQTIKAEIGAGLLVTLQSPQLPSTESILTALLNEIATFPDHFVLILDDYHVIDSKQVDNTLTFLLEHLPPHMHLVIATREDPHLPLARLRARGQLTELRAADLRFTPSEAAEFLNQLMGLNLSAEDVAALENRTEGWIAGLQLASISMQRHSDTTSFIKSFTGSHHFVLDYLIEEVLQQQPKDIQTFLLRTSILDRMCGSLCDTILDSTSASGQKTLEYLEHANLFIVPLDNERCWYRYHQLFGDLLRQRLGQNLTPGEMDDYHIRASIWFEKDGDEAEAFRHAFVAGDYVRAAGLAETAWQGMEKSFQTAAWLGWVKKLPEMVIRTRPALCVQLGWAFSIAGDPETSEIHLQNAEQSFAGAADLAEPMSFAGSIALVRAYNAQLEGDLAGTVKYAELANQLIPENDFYGRSQAAITLELTHWASGNLEAAIQALGDWMESMTQLGNHLFVVASSFAVGDLLVALGHLGEAERAYQDALQLAAQHGPEAEHITAHHHLGLSMIHRQRGEDTLAAHHLKRAAELGLQTTPVWLHRWFVAQAKLKEDAGDLEAALASLDEAKKVYVQSALPDLRPIAALKARIHLKQGRTDKARAWAAERGLSLADEVSYLHEFEHLTLARLELSNTQVNALLARLLQAANAQKRQGSALDILLVQVLAYEAQENHPKALAVLERALSLGEPEGYVRIFVDEGLPMARLLSEAAEQGMMPDYTGKLLAVFEAEKQRGGQKSALSPTQPLIEPLSERELEVLRLVAQGLSNRQIGARLFLALNTVKGHNQKIFNKLQVQSRTEAVALARELDLL